MLQNMLAAAFSRTVFHSSMITKSKMGFSNFLGCCLHHGNYKFAACTGKLTTICTRMSSNSPHHYKPYLHIDAKSATHTDVNTEIIGTIPEWLEGSLYRNGPGVFQVGQTQMRHLFDGFSVLHKFDIRGSKVAYTSRVLDTESWVSSVKANRLVTSQFGTFALPDPCKNVFSRVMSFFSPMRKDITDNTLVNIVELGDQLYAMTETPFLIRVDPTDLHNTGKVDLGKTLAVHMATAHPLFDEQGNMYNLATAFNPPNNYNIIKIPPTSKEGTSVAEQAELMASLQSRWKFSLAYTHSFGMTGQHYVILEQPLTMDTFKFITSNWRHASFYDTLTKRPGTELFFRLVNRKNKKETSISYHAETTFTFHFVNCYEDEERNLLVVDLCGYSDFDVIDQIFLDNLKQEFITSLASFRRYVLPLSIEKAKVGQNLVTLPDSQAKATLRDDGTVFLEPDYITEDKVYMELPRINDRLITKKYRYVYGVIFLFEESSLKKLDLETKKVLAWQEEGYMPGEPVFVSRPGADGEDDGVVLSPVLANTADKASFLLVLDAKTWKEVARAKIPVDANMSLTFHGSFVHP